VFLIALLLTTSPQASSIDSGLNVISYHLTIEPNIDKEYISGTVVIKFQIDKNANSAALKSGNLKIDKVSGEHVIGFENSGENLVIELSEREKEEIEITIDYHGSPRNGLFFRSDRGQAFTIYSTSQWMICFDSPGDRAFFHLNISVPADKDCIASGELVSQERKNDKIQYSYQQNYESPAYTYGFAIGNFNQAQEEYGEVLLKYYSQDYSSDQLLTIFKETPKMIAFFEKKSGVKYDQSSYSQILIGDHYQEMSGYSTLKVTYGKLVLQDSTETNLICNLHSKRCRFRC
jgi:aminopeptidase N